MPAVTVDDLLVLPKIDRPAPGALERQVVSVTTAPPGFEGEGFPVYRAFAGVARSAIDPFVHMDQMGEVDYAPGEPKGTPWHPHRGFETVTYIIDGVFDHQDSNGGGGRITNGDTQWMTAGAGILHIEAPPEFLVASGGLFHGIQLWVNLPAAEKWNPPRYQDLRASAAALLSSPDQRPPIGRGHRRRARRPARAGGDLHADHPPSCHAEPGCRAGPAVAGGLQRARLCAFRARGRRRRAAPRRRSPTGGVRSR